MTAAEGPSGPEDPYTTLAATGEAELRVERSRFLALAAPAPTEAQARALAAACARRHHDARHVCFAWRGGPGPAPCELRADAGEPAGTAGEPILGALRQAQVSDAAVVVARWFGGIKLGTGGLSRAYHAAAAAALARAPRRTVVPGGEHDVRLPYPQEPLVTRLLVRHGGRVLERTYGPAVAWRIWLPAAALPAFAAELRETTAGAALLDGPAA